MDHVYIVEKLMIDGRNMYIKPERILKGTKKKPSGKWVDEIR